MIRLLTVASCILCLACLGCGSSGPPLGTVSGTVTLDGEPVTNGLVAFTPEAGGRGSTGMTDANGKYELAFVEGPGALIGAHKVSVTTVAEAAAAAEMSSDSDAYEQQAMGGSASDYDSAATAVDPIPAKYNSASTLTFEVESGSNTFDITMTTGE